MLLNKLFEFLDRVLIEEAAKGFAKTVNSIFSISYLRPPIGGFLDLVLIERCKTIMNGAKTQRLESLYQQKLTALDGLKKSLLHQAFSGQL